jgi:hypothetical protein
MGSGGHDGLDEATEGTSTHWRLRSASLLHLDGAALLVASFAREDIFLR